jgi:glutathione S-transferase
MPRPVMYHIPVCPFSQRLEILRELKGMRDSVHFHVVDITKPREPWLLVLTGATTTLPVMQDEEGRVLKESLVLLRYFDERFAEPQIARLDSHDRAVERLMITRERPFGLAGYMMVMKREERRKALLSNYRWLDAFLMQHNPTGTWLFDRFGLPETVKLYYDYAVGSGNGALPEGRTRSSFTFEPDWRGRPMPPRDKYDRIAPDAELRLLP